MGRVPMAEAHPGRVGRRLAAIVAADVAGYSRLMGLDEVGTARALRDHRKVTDALVAKHGGRLVKTTGDGVLLEGIAEPGGICISSSAYDQVQGKVAVEFADLGEQRLKNIDRPVRVYAAKSKHIGMVVPVLHSHPEVPKPPPLPDKPSIAVLPFQNMSG